MSVVRRRGWASSLAVAPSLLVALLPRVACPACLAAYGSLLSVFGVGALYRTKLVEPLVAGFLLLGVIGIAWSSRGHGRRGPLALTIVGSALVIANRYLWQNSLMAYAGILSLATASLWNLRCMARRSQLLQIEGPRREETPGV